VSERARGAHAAFDDKSIENALDEVLLLIVKVEKAL
jgi:hypothetical protein